MTFHLSLTREGYYECPNILKKGRGKTTPTHQWVNLKMKGKSQKEEIINSIIK
jgi:hypothetical protein